MQEIQLPIQLWISLINGCKCYQLFWHSVHLYIYTPVQLFLKSLSILALMDCDMS